MIRERLHGKLAFALILIVLVLEIIGGVFLWQEFEKQQSKALLDVKIYNWGTEKGDPSKLLFDFRLVNYGNREARDVQVTCKLFDGAGNPVFSASENFGNVAPLEYDFKPASMTPKPINHPFFWKVPYCIRWRLVSIQDRRKIRTRDFPVKLPTIS